MPKMKTALAGSKSGVATGVRAGARDGFARIFALAESKTERFAASGI